MDPSGFADRLGLQRGVQLTEAGQPLLDEAYEEAIAATYERVELALGESGSSVGEGSLFVTTRRIVWVASGLPSAAAPLSLACYYRQITMHAVSRDTSAFARPCVYLQLDEGSAMDAPAAHSGADDEDDDDQSDDMGAELRLVPADAELVESIFSQLCECSALNPDSDAEEEGGAQLFFDEAEVIAGLPGDQRAALLAARAEAGLGLDDRAADDLDELMADDPERFEDDDEDGCVADTPGSGAGANGHAAAA